MQTKLPPTKNRFHPLLFLLIFLVFCGSAAFGAETPLAETFVKMVDEDNPAGVRVLLRAGLDPDRPVLVREPDLYQTPIAWAAMKGRPEIVEVLLNAGASPNGGANIHNTPSGQRPGSSALSMTVMYAGAPNQARPENYYRAAELLLRHGAHPDTFDSTGMTPLAHAVMSFDAASALRLSQMLLDAGADANLVRSANFFTPLFGAAVMCAEPDEENPDVPKQREQDFALRLEVVELLLSRGADPDKANANGETPLHVAASFSPDVTRTLLAAGADPAVRDKQGKTPLDWAREYGDGEVEAILLDYAEKEQRKR